MFEMDPEMDFGERLSLWWSCFWRQALVGLAFILLFLLCVLLLGQPWKWAAMARQHELAPVVAEFGVLFLMFFIAMIPLNGDVIRRGFVAQQLTAPVNFEFGRAFMLGLTSAGWGFLAGIPVMAISFPLQKLGHPFGSSLVNLALQALATMYIVLPRQARRLRLQCGYDE